MHSLGEINPRMESLAMIHRLELELELLVDNTRNIPAYI